MKKYLLMVAVALMTAMNGWAQQLKVIDSEGNPIAYASVLNSDAEYIGITNLEGVVADLKGAEEIIITHVAFKTKSLKPSDKDQVVVLEDADYNMPEITVQPKPFIYMQTYYRMYIYSSDEGIYYYRAGLTDNAYDPAAQTVKAKTEVVTKAKYAILKTIFAMFGSKIDNFAQMKIKKFEDKMKESGKSVQLKFTDIAPGKQLITDCKGTIGSVTNDMADHLRRFSYDSHQLLLHKLEAEGKEKKLVKKFKRDERKKNRVESDYYVFHIDDEGRYSPEDFIMSQNMTSYDTEDDGKNVHVIIALQVFSTDRAYVTKDELKERKKHNKMKLNFANIRQFERDHNIPALAPAIQQKMNELWKIDNEE